MKTDIEFVSRQLPCLQKKIRTKSQLNFYSIKMSNKRLLTACTSRNVCKPCFLVAFDGTPKHEPEIQIIPIGSFLFLAANNPSMRFKATTMRTSNIWKQIFSGKSRMRIKEFQLEFLFLSLSGFIKFWFGI